MRKIEKYVENLDNKNVQYNVKLFPIYYMFANDFLFFYAIEFVFLLQVKNFTSSQILLLDSMIPLFCILFNIPITLFVERHGKRKSLVIGNICMCLCLILMILSQSLIGIILAFLFNAFGFCFKKLTETNILAESINIKNSKRKSLFSLAYSTGLKNYLVLDGVTSFFIGLTFEINGYLPILISLIFTVISAALSSCFKITEVEEKENNKIRKSFTKEYKKQIIDLKDSFVKFMKSSRLRAFMLFIFLFSGLLYGSYSVRETLLTEYYEVNAATFGIIIASLTVIGGLAEMLQEKIQNTFKNRTLTLISILFMMTYIFTYIISTLNVDINIKLGLTLILFAIQYSIDTLYIGFENTYQKNFTTNNIRVKISSVIEIVRNLSSFLITFIFSFLVGIFVIDKTFLYIGIAFTIIFIFVLLYLKPRFGLKKEQYDKSEIFSR